MPAKRSSNSLSLVLPDEAEEIRAGFQLKQAVLYAPS